MALIVGLPLLACSSDGGDADDATIEGVDADGAGVPGGGGDGAPEPAASEPDEVYPHVAELLGRYDGLVEQIVADPAALESGDLRGDFLDLFVPDSGFAETSLDGWAQMAADGVRLTPASPDHPLNFTYIDGGVRALGDDEVVFRHCTVQRYVRHDDDRETDRTAEPLLLPGTGTAVRVDGEWRLAELTTPPGLTGCTHGSEGP
ncbi:MAG TPA: hypothetical protein VIL36_02210 [Acidimicrobiales bacterium]